MMTCCTFVYSVIKLTWFKQYAFLIGTILPHGGRFIRIAIKKFRDLKTIWLNGLNNFQLCQTKDLYYSVVHKLCNKLECLLKLVCFSKPENVTDTGKDNSLLWIMSISHLLQIFIVIWHRSQIFKIDIVIIVIVIELICPELSQFRKSIAFPWADCYYCYLSALWRCPVHVYNNKLDWLLIFASMPPSLIHFQWGSISH